MQETINVHLLQYFLMNLYVTDGDGKMWLEKEANIQVGVTKISILWILTLSLSLKII